MPSIAGARTRSITLAIAQMRELGSDARGRVGAATEESR